jgi:hypothetical protein
MDLALTRVSRLIVPLAATTRPAVRATTLH